MSSFGIDKHCFAGLSIQTPVGTVPLFCIGKRFKKPNVLQVTLNQNGTEATTELFRKTHFKKFQMK
jgi:hypothetical protein